jgi:hypothetical protein
MRADTERTSLADLEQWLVRVSTDPDGAAAGVRRAALPGAAASLETVVTPGPRLSALERLAIYNDGYFARLLECLRDDYPALAYVLGDGEFERVAHDYVARCPSRSPSLNAFGARLPAYLAMRSEAWAPFAVELARLEWALVEVVHAEMGSPLDAHALATLGPEDWPHVRLSASPALRLLDFTYPVNRFYQAFRAGDEPEPEPPPASASSVAVHRSGLSVYRLELEPVMRILLADLAAGKTLGGALAQLERRLTATELATVQQNLSGWFGAWIESGFFVALERA